MTALEEIKKALEGDMNTGLTAIDRLRFIVGGVPDFDPITVEDADWLISALESLQRENATLKNDRYDLAYAITGGEDAPGLLDSTPTSEIVEIARHAHRSHSADIDRAEAAEAEVARLQAEIDRKSSMPGDHRYWEGRYREEAAHNDKLREALEPFAKFGGELAELKQRVFLQILICPNGDHHADNYGPHFARARTALDSTGGEHHAE